MPTTHTANQPPPAASHDLPPDPRRDPRPLPPNEQPKCHLLSDTLPFSVGDEEVEGGVWPALNEEVDAIVARLTRRLAARAGAGDGVERVGGGGALESGHEFLVLGWGPVIWGGDEAGV